MLNVPNLTSGARLKIKLGCLNDDLTFGLFMSQSHQLKCDQQITNTLPLSDLIVSQPPIA